jgi:hypothetical protein
MGLRMATPWKHPNSGIYWLRRRVPSDLVDVVGRREEKLSLRTRDPAEAKSAYVKAAAELEARWSSLRQGTKRVSHKEATAIAGEFYRQLVSSHEEDPGDARLALGKLLSSQVAAGFLLVGASRSSHPSFRFCTDRPTRQPFCRVPPFALRPF